VTGRQTKRRGDGEEKGGNGKQKGKFVGSYCVKERMRKAEKRVSRALGTPEGKRKDGMKIAGDSGRQKKIAKGGRWR